MLRGDVDLPVPQGQADIVGLKLSRGSVSSFDVTETDSTPLMFSPAVREASGAVRWIPRSISTRPRPSHLRRGGRLRNGKIERSIGFSLSSGRE
jgi:hypothetical protein